MSTFTANTLLYVPFGAIIAKAKILLTNVNGIFAFVLFILHH